MIQVSAGTYDCVSDSASQPPPTPFSFISQIKRLQTQRDTSTRPASASEGLAPREFVTKSSTVHVW